MNKPKHQVIFQRLQWTILGFLLLANVIGSVMSAVVRIKPIFSIFATVILVLGSVLLDLYLRKNPVDWISSDGVKTRIKNLGMQPIAAISGMILLLWLPVILNSDEAQAIAEQEESPIFPEEITINVPSLSDSFEARQASSFNPHLRVDDLGGGTVELYLSTNKVPDDHSVHVSTDGKKFAPYAARQELLLGSDRSLIVQLWDAEDKVVNTVDLSDELHDRLQTNFDKSINRVSFTRQDWGCDIAGCNFAEYNDDKIVCNSLVTSAFHVDPATNRRVPIDLSTCRSVQAACVAHPNLTDRYTLIDSLLVELELFNKEKVELAVPVSWTPNKSRFQSAERNSEGHNWRWVPPKSGKNNQPHLVSKYNPPENDYSSSAIKGSFSFQVVSPSCGRHTRDQRVNRNLVVAINDSDLIPFGSYKPDGHFTAYMYASKESEVKAARNRPGLWPAAKEISFAIDTDLVDREGPYSYELDLSSIIEDTGSYHYYPLVQCVGSGSRTSPRVCVAKYRASFMNVDYVEFGSSESDLTEKISIDYSGEDHLTSSCDTRKDDDCLPFLFKVPGDWDVVFSRVTDNSGKQYLPVRHAY